MTILSLYLVAATTMERSLRNDRSLGCPVVSTELFTKSLGSVEKVVDTSPLHPSAEPSVSAYTTNPTTEASGARLARWIASDRSLHFACAMEGATIEAQVSASLAEPEVTSDWPRSHIDESETDLASQSAGIQDDCVKIAWDHSGCAPLDDSLIWEFHDSSADGMALLDV